MKARFCIAATLLVACSSDPTPLRDIGSDASRPEVDATDTALDAVEDVELDLEDAQDVRPDTEPDAEPDVDRDPEPDASDVVDDRGPDTEPDVDRDTLDADVDPEGDAEPDTDVPPDSDVEPDVSEEVAPDADDADLPDAEPDVEELTLSEILDALREHGEDAAYEFARSDGWPIAVESGYLVVSFDPAATQVAGDFSDWSGLPLEADAGFAYGVVTGSAGHGYKLTNGTFYWPDPLARSYTIDEFGELSQLAPLGVHFDRWHHVSDGVVAPRQLNVLVPAAPATHVVYAQDGQNLFDDSRASFGFSWDLQASTPDAMMVVGVDHGPDRVYEYTWIEDDLRGTITGGGGDEYADFVQSYVRPMIDDAYGEPATVGVMGSSLGGVISLYIAHRHPDEFDMAISLSGTLGWGSFGTHQETLLNLYRDAGVRSTRLYVDSGGGVSGDCVDTDADGILDDNETGADNFCTNRQFADEMADLGYEWAVNLWHWWEPDAPHNEAAWAARIFRPLEYFAE